MKTFTKITAILLLVLTTTSCFVDGLAGIKGNGDVVTEDRTIHSNFNSIKVQQGIQVFLTQGNSTELRVEADENIIDLLITEVKNNELKIYFEKNVYKAKSRNVYLTANEISKIKTSSGALVKTENTIETNTIELDSSSGSSIDADELTCIEAYANASSGANINVNVSDKLTASASSGGDIDFEGNPKNVNKDTSSGGSVSGN